MKLSWGWTPSSSGAGSGGIRLPRKPCCETGTRMVCFYAYPQPHWQHIRTTNPVESSFAALRLRTDAAKRYKRVDRATAVMWRLLMVAERRFRRLNGAQLLPDVYRAHLLVSKEKERRVVEEVAA